MYGGPGGTRTRYLPVMSRLPRPLWPKALNLVRGPGLEPGTFRLKVGYSRPIELAAHDERGRLIGYVLIRL